MELYIGVDCGKYSTKYVYFTGGGDPAFESGSFRSKLSRGVFIDDMIEPGTFISQVDGGEVYKSGFAATETPSAETSKRSDFHRTCTLEAIALAMKAKKLTEADVCVAIGMPLSISGNPEERIAYKDFILGEDGSVHTVKLKTGSDEKESEYTFTIKKRFVYPEGIGAIYVMPRLQEGPRGIIDIGNLNTNHLYVDGFMVKPDYSFTDELGGKILIAELAQKLSSEFNMRFTEDLVAKKLRAQPDQRFFTLKRGTEEQKKEFERRSAQVISDKLLEHVMSIKTKCDTKKWPMDFMDLYFIGGTTRLLGPEIRKVFGSDIFIPQNAESVNALGFLVRMSASIGINTDAAIGRFMKA